MPSNDTIKSIESDITSCDIQITVSSIQSKIFTVRGVQVMLDRDLADLYQVQTSHLNRQVKRNIDRFPSDFMFQLTQEEFEYLRCQNVIANLNKVRYLPFVFTEEGVSTLSSVLKSPIASITHVAVMRAFVAMRRFIAANAGIFQRLEQVERHQIETDQKTDQVLDALEDGSLKEKAHIFSSGQIFDAKAFTAELISKAEERVVLVDGYVTATTFNLLEARRDGVSAVIFTDKVGDSLLELKEQYNKQYTQKHLEIKKWKTPQHDRWLIIDNELWHCGASIKDAGIRTFCMDKIELDVDIILKQM